MDTRNPVRWAELTARGEDDIHRWEDCDHYETCLGDAARGNWDGWSCSMCAYNPRATRFWVLCQYKRYSSLLNPRTRLKDLRDP